MCVFVRVCDDDDDDTLGLSVCPSVFGAQWRSRRQTGSIPGCYGRCRKPARVAQSGGAVGGCAIVLLFISACVCLCVRVSVCLCHCVCVCGVAFFLFEDLSFEYVLLFEELFVLMGYCLMVTRIFVGGGRAFVSDHLWRTRIFGVAFFLFEDLLFECVLLFEELFSLMGYFVDGDTHFCEGIATILLGMSVTSRMRCGSQCSSRSTLRTSANLSRR